MRYGSEQTVDVDAGGAARAAEDPGWRLAHLPLLLAVSTTVMLSAATVGFLASGATAAAGAGLGVLLVIVSYSLTTLVVAWADTVAPRLVLPLGVGVYIAKFSLLGVIMVGVSGTDWGGKIPLGLGVVAGVLAWTAAQIWWVVRIWPATRGNTATSGH